MSWLSENWPYLLLMLGVIVLVTRRGGMGCGLMGMGGHAQGHSHDQAQSTERRVDPVSGEPVSGAGDVVASYRGRLYYFNSRENRDRFEATPARFVQSGEEGHRHGHGGHGGCC